MSQVPVKWVDASSLKDNAGECDCSVGSIGPVPVVPLSALREVVEDIIGQAHGGAMLGGDDAYKACLKIDVLAQRLLASLGEVEK